MKGPPRIIVLHVCANSIEHAAHHDDRAGRLDFFAKDFGAVRRRENRLADVEPYFAAIDIESGDDFDVVRPIRPDLLVHQADTCPVAGRAAIEVDSLEKRTRAVADPDDRDWNFTHSKPVDWRTRCLRASSQMLKLQIDRPTPRRPSIISRETEGYHTVCLNLMIEGIRGIAFMSSREIGILRSRGAPVS